MLRPRRKHFASFDEIGPWEREAIGTPGAANTPMDLDQMHRAARLKPGAPSRVGMGLRWRWTLATMVGHVAGALFWLMPFHWIWRGEGQQGGPASMVVMFGFTMLAALGQGALLGLVQSLALRQVEGIRSARWAAASAMGVVCGWLVFVVVAPSVGAISTHVSVWLPLVALGGLVFGALVGAAQGHLLRARQPALPWILANSLGWAVALLLTVGTFYIVESLPLAAVGVVAAVAAGLALGTITAIPLARVPM